MSAQSPSEQHNAFRAGRVHVCREMCSTCVFRPGNPMHLRAGRLREMINDACRDESAIICHSTLPAAGASEQAVCRGFFDRHPTMPLQLAERMGLVEMVAPPLAAERSINA